MTQKGANNPQALNGYAYADNNPNTNSDPSGLRAITADGSECAGNGSGHTCDAAYAADEADAKDRLDYGIKASGATPQAVTNELRFMDRWGSTMFRSFFPEAPDSHGRYTRAEAENAIISGWYYAQAEAAAEKQAADAANNCQIFWMSCRTAGNVGLGFAAFGLAMTGVGVVADATIVTGFATETGVAATVSTASTGLALLAGGTSTLLDGGACMEHVPGGCGALALDAVSLGFGVAAPLRPGVTKILYNGDSGSIGLLGYMNASSGDQ